MVPRYYTNTSEKGSYSNPKVDQLLDNLGLEFDQKKRLKIFKELAWTLHNDVANIPPLLQARYSGMSEKVQGYGPPPGQALHGEVRGTFFRHVWLK